MEKTLQGKLVTDGKRVLRIFYTNSFVARAIVCSMDGKEETEFTIETFNTSELWNLIHTEALTIVEENEPPFLDIEDFSKEEIASYKKIEGFINDVRNIYGNEYVNLASPKKKGGWEAVLEKHGIGRSSGWKYIRRYLQSGLRMSSIIDRRKLPRKKTMRVGTLKSNPGRHTEDSYTLTEKDLEYMDIIIDEFMHDEVAFKEDYFCKLLTDYYLDENGEIKDAHPSRNQFKYYLNLKKSFAEQAKRKVDKIDARNNYRSKLGNPGLMIQRPGQILELDECELDVLIVSSVNRRQIIGKPILYLASDILTHAATGMSIQLHNNSFLGVSSLFLNMFEGGEAYFRRHGLTEGFECLPTGFCPDMVRTDQGAEYTAEDFERLCSELGASATLLPVKQGSLKGSVERKFGFIQNFLRPHLKDRGLIRNTYGSNHYETARYTIEEITQICIEIIKYYNTNKVDKFPARSRAMSLEAGKIPIEMWNYGCRHYGAPLPITDANRNEYFYKCLLKKSALVSGAGLTIDGMNYYENIPELNDMINRAAVGGGSKEVKVGIDPRDMGHIYLNCSGRIVPLPLNEGKMGYDYGNTQWTEYLKEREIINKRDAEDDKKKTKAKAMTHKRINDILNASEVSKYKPKRTGIPEARAEEKERQNKKDGVYERMGFSEEKKPIDIFSDSFAVSDISDEKQVEESAATTPQTEEIDFSSMTLDEISRYKQGTGLAATIKNQRKIDT